MLPEYPELLLVVSFLVLCAATALGTWLSRRYPADEAMHHDFGLVLGAALTMLALIVGFSFSMAAGRYEQRRDLEGVEANTIGTEYQRADLLPAADGAAVKALLKSYTDLRVQFYTVSDSDELGKIEKRTEKVQQELWAAMLPVAAAHPTPITALVITGMNEALDSQSAVQAAWFNRIPTGAWCLLAIMSFGSVFFLGYGFRSNLAVRRLSFAMPLLVSIALGLIADIDSPRRGIIRVQPQNLLELTETMH